MGKFLNHYKKKLLRTYFSLKYRELTDYYIYYKKLSGKKGLEIGGPSQIFEKKGILPIYPIINGLDGCNFSENTVWNDNIQKGMFYNYGDNKGYQFICDAVDLCEIKSNSYDFILASHVIEHLANPFNGLTEWIRVLKDNGILLLVIPHKEGTFDHLRPVTPLKHLIKDFKSNVQENDLSHLTEILKLHDLTLDPAAGDLNAFKQRSLDNYENRCLHQHVFDSRLAIKILNYFKIKILAIDFVLPFHIILLGEKTKLFQMEDNDRFLDKNADFIKKSPFKSDREYYR